MSNLNPNQRIYDVMAEIKRGTYRIPNIQRGFEWDKPRIAKLLDSIMNGYPIGAIMVWKPTPDVQKDISDRAFVADFRQDQDYLSDAPHASDAEAYLVLDGQQRLQSLYLSFFGSYDGARMYLGVDHFPSATDDDQYDFAFLTPEEAKDQNRMVPLAHIVSLDSDTKSDFSENLAKDLAKSVPEETERQRVESDKRKKISRNVDRFIERFNVQPVLLIQEVSSRQTYDHVLEIFERVNSGGMVLSKSDLLFSTLKLKLKEKEAEFKATIAAINHGNRYAFNTDFLIKTSLLVLGKGSKYDVKKLKDDDYVSRLKQLYPILDKCLRQIVAWLDETALIKCDRFLPSHWALIPLVDYMLLSGRHEKPDGENSEAMKQYIHMAFFTRLFGRSSDSMLDRIHKELVLSMNGDPEQGIAPEKAFPLPRLQQIIQNATNAPYALYHRFFSDDPDLMLNIVQGGQLQIDPTDPQKHAKDLKLEVDHIFPRSRLRDAGMGDIADRIGNFRLVVLPVNRRKTNHWPDGETHFFGSDDPALSVAYRNALISWNRDNYIQFESSRAAFIQRRVEEFLGLKIGAQTAPHPRPQESASAPTPQPATPQADASVEALCQQADASGVGPDFRRFCAAGLRLGLYPRLWKSCVMFTPPRTRNRMLFGVWTQPVRKKLRAYVSARVIAEFYPVSISEAANAIGEDGWRELDSEAVTKVLQGYEDLFATFHGHTKDTEHHDQSNANDAGPEVPVEGGPGIYIVNTNSRHYPDAWRDMLSASKASAYYDRKHSVAKIPEGSVVYLFQTGVGIIAKGRTTSVCQKIAYENDPDEEFFVPLNMEWKLDDPTSWNQAVRASEIKEKMQTYHPFRGTAYRIPKHMAAAIDAIRSGRIASPS